MPSQTARMLGCLLLLAAGRPEAALFDRGGGLIYDSDLRVTWLQDANLSATQAFGVEHISPLNGGMSWYVAQTWLAELNRANYLGYSDWRLPTVRPVNGLFFSSSFSIDGSTDIGYNINRVSSELSHLYYTDLVGTPRSPALGNPGGQQENGLYDIGLFRNVQTEYAYLTGTEFFASSTDVLSFSFDHRLTIGSTPYDGGFQGIAGKSYLSMFMILRDGDVVASPIPEPRTFHLMVVALGILLAVRGKRLRSTAVVRSDSFRVHDGD